MDSAFVTLELDDNNISNNRAYRLGGGIGINADTSGSVTVVSNNNTISDNIGEAGGGGIYLNPVGLGSSLNFASNNDVVNGNETNYGYAGGGISTYSTSGAILSLNINGATINNNDATPGGGISMQPNGSTVNVTISNSDVSGNLSNTYGGGFYIIDRSNNFTLNLNENTISNNRAANYDGAGIYYEASSSTPYLNLYKNIILSNRASRSGGGIYVWNKSNLTMILEKNSIFSNGRFVYRGGAGIYIRNSGLMSLEMINNIIAKNKTEYAPANDDYGGGIYITNSGSINVASVNNTITGNIAEEGGGGIYVTSSGTAELSFVNDILFDNTGPVGADIFNYMNTASISIAYSDIGDIFSSYINGGGNINIDPLFVDAINGDYHLTDLSPCIGAGTNEGAPTTDKDGNPRPNPPGSNCDMGAYENPLGLVTDIIPLNQGRNWVSTNVFPPDSSVASVMATILDSLVAVRGFDLQGVSHGQGANGWLIYDPNKPSPHSTLRWIQPGFGYCIATLAVDDTLEVSGNPIPGDTPLELNRWWNLVAYLPESSMDVPTALESIGGENIYTRHWTGSYRVVRGFDLNGIEHGQGADGALTFDPTLPESFSTLKLMMNNFGYWIKIKEDATDSTLVYPVGGGLAKAVASIQSQYPRRGDFTFTPTLEWVDFYGTATVDGHPVRPGDIVTVYDEDGVQCGGFVVHTEGLIGFIPVYGDDKATPGVDEGAEEGDRLSFFINDRLAEDPSQGSLIWTRDGDIKQVVLSVVGVEPLEVPREYALYQNHPNPFNLGTEIVYQLPEESHVRLVVYNLMGQVVKTLVDDSLSAGSYRVSWDGRDEEGVEVGSGVYFYRMDAQAGSGSDEFVSVKRMIVLK